MLYGHLPFLARLSITRQAAITGEPGTGKDLLARELALHWLDRGYKYYSNSVDIWNDPLYVEMSLSSYYDSMGGYKGKDPLVDRVDLFPDVKKRLWVITEAGIHMREWKYFQNINVFKRKFDNVFLYPSMRLPHEDLSELYCYCAINLREYLPGMGLASIWSWVYESGRGSRLGGQFLFIPSIIGTYATEDLSISPEIALKCFNTAIDLEQRRFGRNGISALETSQENGFDLEALAAIQRKSREFALSLQKKR